MQVVENLNTSHEAPPRVRRLNSRLIIALVFDVVAWALIIGAVWGAMKLLKLA